MPPQDATDPLPRYVMRVKAGPTRRPVWAVQWHRVRADGTRQQTSRKLGPAWLDDDGAGGWKPRPGRPRGDFLDRRNAELLVPGVIRGAEKEFAEAARIAAEPPTFREIANAFLDHREHVRGSRPSTMTDYRSMLAEPGTPHKRGGVRRDAAGRPKLDSEGRPIPLRTSVGWLMRDLGDRPAESVTTRDINAVLGQISASGASSRTVNKYRALLSAVYGHACQPSTFALRDNPVGAADLRRQPPPQVIEFYSREEVELLARSFTDGSSSPSPQHTQDAELVRLAAYSGLRRSELLALRWSDVDFVSRTIHVRASVSSGKEVDSPKSGRRRVVPMTDDAGAALDRLSRRAAFAGPRDYVAVSAVGARLNADAFGKRVREAQDRAGLRRLRLHGLRHTFASQLVAGGIGLADVQAAMGHADVKTTGRYTHARPAASMAADFTRAQRAHDVAGDTPGSVAGRTTS